MEIVIKDGRREAFVAHPTTQAVISAIAALKEADFAPKSFLDIGCASGILSLAALDAWPDITGIATDCSRQALKDFQENTEKLARAGQVRAVRSESPEEQAIQQHAPFDLLMANVLASYHIRHAKTLHTLCAHGGYAIISGLRAWEQAGVEEALLLAGFIPKATLQSEAWVSLVVQKG
jgi:ribosomal protein L11 methyltransferase